MSFDSTDQQPSPPALAGLQEESGHQTYRAHAEVPMRGWAILDPHQLWVWLSGLKPLGGGTGDDPYTYEVWIAYGNGESRSLGALAPSPGGIALAQFSTTGLPYPGAVLITVQSRSQARPLAVVVSGRLAASGQHVLNAQPPTAPATESQPEVPTSVSPSVIPTATEMPELAPVAGGSGAAAPPLPEAPPAAPPNLPGVWPWPVPNPTGMPAWPGAPTGRPMTYYPMAPAPFATPFPGQMADYQQYPAPMGGDQAPAATAVAPAVVPAASSPVPAEPAQVLSGDTAPTATVTQHQPDAAAPAPGGEIRCPPGFVPVPRAEVGLTAHGDRVPNAQATAMLDFDRGGALVTLRDLPAPGTLGTSAVTGREFNAYRVWVQSSATRELQALGIAARVWTDTYRLQVPEGIPLRRFDSLLVSAEDRAGTGQPAGPIVMSGRYRWYEAPVER